MTQRKEANTEPGVEEYDENTDIGIPVYESHIKKFRPQEQNANLHTERGLAALEDSMQRDGWIGAITVAADNEAFDGSARLEKAGATGFEEALVIDIEGDKPVILRRVDIPTAKDPRARRLGIAANRVAQLDLNWSAQVLEELKTETPDVLDGLWTHVEFDAQMRVQSRSAEGGGGDDFDVEAARGPERVRPGQMWRIGPHRLVCGDASSRSVASLLLQDDDQIPALLLTDPPYNVGVEYGAGIDDNKSPEDYRVFLGSWFFLWQELTERQIVTPGYDEIGTWLTLGKPAAISPWIKLNSMTHGSITRFFCWEPILFYGEGYKRVRANNVFDFPVSEQRMEDGKSLTGLHPCPKPLALWMDLLTNFTEYGDLVADPMSGTGTTLIAAHRTKRVARIGELSARSCDVILMRAEAEGIAPIYLEYDPEPE